MSPSISKSPVGLFLWNEIVFRSTSKRNLANWLVYESTYFPPPSCMVSPTPEEAVEDIISKTKYIEPMDKRFSDNIGYDKEKDMMYFKISTLHQRSELVE